MFNQLKDKLIGFITTRLFVLTLVLVGLCIVLMHRIFDLQIVNGAEYLANFKLRIKKERALPGTRGNIYDRNGKLLAYNELAYNVTIEDVYESGRDKNDRLNGTILRLIKIIEDNGNRVVNDFSIVLDRDGQYQFAVDGNQRLRFLADVYGRASVDNLSYRERTATPGEVMDYLSGTSRYGLGHYINPDKRQGFIPGAGYTKEEVLKVITIRFAMSANSYQRYIATTVATAVNPKTVAVVLENADELDGVNIAESTIRKYNDSVYFSHILGWTGKISQEELADLKKSNDSYTATDIIGKAGIEQVMELDLQGRKGYETMYVDNLGKILEITSRTSPTAGNNLYLTIDRDLQRAVYNILEQKIAGILVSRLENTKEFEGSNTAATLRIPIYDVYYALINNSIIDVSHLESDRAGDTERQVHSLFLQHRETIFNRLREELLSQKTVYSLLSDEYQVYESFIINMLSSRDVGILEDDDSHAGDAMYKAWHTEESVSLSEYLHYAIAQNWIDVTRMNIEASYASSEEIFNALVEVIIDRLSQSTEFSKRVYRYMIRDDYITGNHIGRILLEQHLVDVTKVVENAFLSGSMNAYTFMTHLIEHLYITPAMLALDPCSGSCVITDVNNGEVLALVTYPGYDINRLANTIDADYYSRLQKDLSRPMWNYATQQKTAPGSTFKMVSAVAGIQENVITTGEQLVCEGLYDKIDPSPSCWNRNGHGSLDVTGGIANSCNSFFYEIGYRLGAKGRGYYDSDIGLEKLHTYADLFGLTETSGIEISESEPEVSDFDAVRSSIGQGTHNMTTIGLARYVTTVANSGTCFNLSIMDKTTDSNGLLLKDFTPQVRNQVDLPNYLWGTLHRGMRQVIESKKYYDDMPVEVAGKTGTAQENRNRANHALFVGYAPYHNPSISIATRVANGYTSNYAAEISRDVLRYYFDPEGEDVITGTASVPEASAGGGD